MTIEYEILRHLVLEALKDNTMNQWATLRNSVASLAMQNSYIKNTSDFNNRDEENIREIMHGLYVQGIIVFGMNASNPNWPWFKITDYGSKCLASSEIIPYDPEEYLSKLRMNIPNIDEAIISYVTESLETFLRGCYMASTVMLGCASEKALILLSEAYQNTIIDTRAQEAFRKKMETNFIKTRFDKLNHELNSIKANFPDTIREDLETILNGIFTLIRNYRNDVGHPTGRIVSREVAYANLILFSTYCKKVYDLIEYFNK
ncbi:MAG: hypothetical protein PHD29_05895 [bacterium]|nr:hypothetical protein [bacterium]